MTCVRQCDGRTQYHIKPWNSSSLGNSLYVSKLYWIPNVTATGEEFPTHCGLFTFHSCSDYARYAAMLWLSGLAIISPSYFSIADPEVLISAVYSRSGV